MSNNNDGFSYYIPGMESIVVEKYRQSLIRELFIIKVKIIVALDMQIIESTENNHVHNEQLARRIQSSKKQELLNLIQSHPDLVN